MKPVIRAGLIPYIERDGEIHMMFMLPSDPTYGGDRFQIAKGEVDPGEAVECAAIREAEEELGLVQDNMKFQPVNIGKFLGHTHVYVVEVEDQNNFTEPHYETGDVIWWTKEQFLLEGREIHSHVVIAAIKKINSILKEK